MAQVAMGQVEEGLASLHRAVRLEPGHRFAWDAIGRTLLALDRPDDATTAWAAALETAPDDVDLLVALAVALAAADRTGEALRVLHRATEVAPHSARAWVQLGVVALLRQDHGTAGEALLTALDLDPDDPHARFHLALLHVLVGAVAEARAALADLAAGGGSCADEARALLARLPPAPGDGAGTVR
jgi:Flp pilus assembly protein TadD